MKLKKFKEKNKKKISITIFTLVCIFLVSGVILYRTFAIFEVKTNQNVINGTIQDPGNIYFAFYVNEDNEDRIQKEMPNKNYVLDEEKSYCGVNGEKDPNIKVTLTEEYGVYVTGITSSRTKCNLYFVSGAFILGKPIKAITKEDGLYEVTHEDTLGTINDNGFKETEFRYAGKDPNNYIKFNEENWRIIGLVNVMTSDNKVEQRVKIVKDDSIGQKAWDTSNSNNWTTSSLMTELNGDYYNNTLINQAKSMIEENIYWNIGGVKNYDYSLISEWYNMERWNIVYANYAESWHGKVGLIYPSDYGYAASGSTNEIREKCLKDALYSWDKECVDDDWLFDSTQDLWTLTHRAAVSTSPVRIFHSDTEPGYYGVVRGSSSCTQKHGVYPTTYLKNNVKIINDDQDGSYEKPYNLKLME